MYTLNEDKNKPWSAVTYKTGNMTTADDLVNRLESAGVQNYSREIPTPASPLLNFLTTWVFPILMFVIIGQLMGRMMAKRMGGGSSAMTFGKSNAKMINKLRIESIRFETAAVREKISAKSH